MFLLNKKKKRKALIQKMKNLLPRTQKRELSIIAQKISNEADRCFRNHEGFFLFLVTLTHFNLAFHIK